MQRFPYCECGIAHGAPMGCRHYLRLARKPASVQVIVRGGVRTCSIALLICPSARMATPFGHQQQVLDAALTRTRHQCTRLTLAQLRSDKRVFL